MKKTGILSDTAERAQITFYNKADPLSISRRNTLYGNMFGGINTALTGGVYFTSLMLAMGAEASFIGWVGAAGTLCGIFQVISPLLLERLPQRASLLIFLRAVYHFLNIIVLGVLPILPIDMELKLVLFFIVFVLLNAACQLASPGFQAWHMQNMTKDSCVDFYAISNLGVTAVNYISAFMAGVLLDRFELREVTLSNIPPTLSAILVLRAVMIPLAVLECVSYSHVQEHPYPNTAKITAGIMLEPLKNRKFLRMISFALFGCLSGGTIGQYFNVYLLEDMQMSYSLITVASFLCIPIMVIFTPFWSRKLRSKSVFTMTAISQFGFVFAYGLNAFITPSTKVVYFVCVVLGAVFNIGLSVSYSNVLFQFSPEVHRSAYMGFYSITTQLFSFIGISLGIRFVETIGDAKVCFLSANMNSHQLINLLASALILVTSCYTYLTGRSMQGK